MIDDASSLFYLPDNFIIVHMNDAYPQPLSSWKTPPPHLQLISCVISPLRRKPFEKEQLKIHDIGWCARGGNNNASPCGLILISNVHTSIESIS